MAGRSAGSAICQQLLARQVEQILRRHGDAGAAGLHHLCRRIDIRLRVLDVLGVDLQVIEGRGALGSAEGRGDRRSVEVDIQHVVFRLLRRDQVRGRDVAECLVACQIRLSDSRGEASLRDARDRKARLRRAGGRNAAPRGRVAGVGRKRAGASFLQGEIREGRVELRPAEDLSRRRR